MATPFFSRFLMMNRALPFLLLLVARTAVAAWAFDIFQTFLLLLGRGFFDLCGLIKPTFRLHAPDPPA